MTIHSNLGGGQIDYLLDARGNLLRRKDSYVTIDRTYDGLDRMLSVSATNSLEGNNVAYTFAYDAPGAVGRLSSVTSAERTVRFSYDPAGRLETETVEEAGVAVPLVTTYSYDADGAIAGVVYPSGLSLTYERDPATRQVVRVVDGNATIYADAVERRPAGPVQSLTFGSNLTLAQSFNLRQEPLSVSSGPLSLGYAPSPAGDVASLTEGQTTRNFEYDFLDRLTGSPDWFSYGHDWKGNRTSETLDGVTARYQYSVERLTTRQLPGATAGTWVNDLSFFNDTQANLAGISRYASNGATVTAAACFRHDALGRLIFAGVRKPAYTTCPTDAGVQTPIARFQYDARNRRVARFTVATGEWTHFVYDPAGALLSELRRTGDPSNPWAKVRDYVWLDGRPIAQIEYVDGVAHPYYFHLDAIGLPRALTSQAGQTVWSATPARPYGDLVETTTPDPVTGQTVVTNLRLPGQYDERLLGSVGLQGPYYNWNRWYLPGVGRYLELDPIALGGGFNGAWGPDWYGYAGGNPLRYVDPLGLDRYEACKNEDFGRARRWICKKAVDWRCDKNPGEQAICCEADAADCRTTANGDTMELTKCELKKAQCQLKPPKPPDPPKKPLCQ